MAPPNKAQGDAVRDSPARIPRSMVIAGPRSAVSDALVKTHHLFPQAVAFGSEIDNTLDQFCGRMIPA